ncbi:MAG: hypothetical protein A2W61_07930 [Deltaproteobacteria bacterium RIFCSPLOWO2_01_44_7]|nr:MAG: hypothetical protein A2712_10310 [Deltaproteobacteria bacterium RIFCSPHIGHO2_01_FULL_43_49]OGQ28444.1 MAG: hypothetical protein A3D98_03025 [Deltaproteobacteria bacterium RIFCSPHIGHO2_12_FULL_44_21]OGQ32308.1 MAG: hypothetical protein A2979_00685 [Deltaproteobacteria bacterium RIFCSPLOWO2_01_FULL_45_74]OGQ37671.1 MAG: hypothetical protein A2W61_07930 [Deltaproteobacteria bacterium RIFCSPLOWO2_01_44_7]OGQ43950.1 MAG: hypothetical protein A3I70_04585 [Deltaproteobacteria bacterium RIFCSPL
MRVLPFSSVSTSPDINILLGIANLEAVPLDGELREPFVIASDSSKQTAVDNVLVRLTSVDGYVGLGEASPFPGISGDSQALLLKDIKRFRKRIIGRSLTLFDLENQTRQAMKFSASRAALEMAFFDILAKRAGIPLGRLLSRQTFSELPITDITIPIVTPEKARVLAQKYLELGLYRIKIKVGKDVEESVARVKAIVEVYGTKRIDDHYLEILIDANEGYSAEGAIELLKRLSDEGIYPKIFEQPVQRKNLTGLRQVKLKANQQNTRVFADESVYTKMDAAHIIDGDAADGINLKLMKHGGILEAIRIAEMARRYGLQLMIGGMVETTLAMTASLHLAKALGGLEWFDLDTPLLLHQRLLTGGMGYVGAQLILPQNPGIGVSAI